MSYAWFTLTLNGTKQNVIKVGKLSLVLDDSMGEGINLNPAVPTYTNVALGEKPYTFTVTNDGTVDADYSLYLDNTGTVTYLNYFNYVLKKDGKVLSTNSLSKLTDSMLFQGTIHPGESSSYELYLWVDANTTSKAAEKNGILTGTYEGTLRLESSQQREKTLASYISSYDCGGANCTRVVDDITYFQQSYYDTAATMKYIWYSGRMWVVTSYDSEGNIKATTLTEQTYMPWGPAIDYQGSYVEHWLNNKFLPSLNNYEKFLVTDYPWNYSSETGANITDPIGNDVIVNGPVGILNKEDLHHGSKGNDYMNSDDRILIVLGEDYYTATTTTDGKRYLGGDSYITHSKYTLNEQDFAGVLPSIVFKKDVVVASGSGTKSDPYRLKGDESGTSGELLNTRYAGEYIAFGEGLNSSYRISEVENGKVKIVSTQSLKEINIENNGRETWQVLDQNYYLTDEFPNYLYCKKDGNFCPNGDDYSHYDANSADYPMAYFLNHGFLDPTKGYISITDKNMIATDQTFYTGTITGSSNYTAAKEASNAVTATVGLPILGDTFAHPQLEDNVYSKSIAPAFDSTLFMTSNGEYPYVHFMDYDFNSSTGNENTSFRPSFYLKNTVKIRGGSGTKSDPYYLIME